MVEAMTAAREFDYLIVGAGTAVACWRRACPRILP